MAPLAFVSAGLATVTLSACYGPACATTIHLPDGGTRTTGTTTPSCTDEFDCNKSADGGTPEMNSEWKHFCQ